LVLNVIRVAIEKRPCHLSEFLAEKISERPSQGADFRNAGTLRQSRQFVADYFKFGPAGTVLVGLPGSSIALVRAKIALRRDQVWRSQATGSAAIDRNTCSSANIRGSSWGNGSPKMASFNRRPTLRSNNIGKP
jgi:hypothetical protein